MTDMETRLASLEARVDHLEGGRSGRKGMPIIVTVDGYCGVAPDIDSSTCPFASLYRRQQGCLGDACKKASSDYYAKYRASKVKGKNSKVTVRKK